jgi:hypothetical protein
MIKGKIDNFNSCVREFKAFIQDLYQELNRYESVRPMLSYLKGNIGMIKHGTVVDEFTSEM